MYVLAVAATFSKPEAWRQQLTRPVCITPPQATPTIPAVQGELLNDIFSTPFSAKHDGRRPKKKPYAETSHGNLQQQSLLLLYIFGTLGHETIIKNMIGDLAPRLLSDNTRPFLHIPRMYSTPIVQTKNRGAAHHLKGPMYVRSVNDRCRGRLPLRYKIPRGLLLSVENCKSNPSRRVSTRSQAERNTAPPPPPDLRCQCHIY